MALNVLPSKLIPLGKMVPNDWNPKEDDELVFNALAGSIDEIGFSENLQVVPMALMSKAFREKYPDAEFVIVNGEHRWSASMILDPEASVPAVVWGENLVKPGMTEKDRERILAEMKARTSRMELLRFGIDPGKFTALYDEIVKTLGRDRAHEAMGITSEKVLKGLVKRATAGLPKDVADRVEEAAKHLQSVDDLSAVLGQLMQKYGRDLEHSFMFFVFGKRVHMMVELPDKHGVKTLEAFAERMREAGQDMAVALLDMMGVGDEG